MGYQWKLRTEFQTGKKLSLWIVKLGSVLPKNRKFGAKHLECRADFLAHVNGVLFSTLFIFFSKTLGNLFIKRHAENLKFTVCKLRYLGLLTSNVFRRNHILKLTLFQISQYQRRLVRGSCMGQNFVTYRQHIWTISLSDSCKDCSYFVGLTVTYRQLPIRILG